MKKTKIAEIPGALIMSEVGSVVQVGDELQLDVDEAEWVARQLAKWAKAVREKRQLRCPNCQRKHPEETFQDSSGFCCNPQCRGIWGTGCFHCHHPDNWPGEGARTIAVPTVLWERLRFHLLGTIEHCDCDIPNKVAGPHEPECRAGIRNQLRRDIEDVEFDPRRDRK